MTAADPKRLFVKTIIYIKVRNKISQKMKYEIVFFKYPYEKTMTIDKEKTLMREFVDQKEADDWAEEYCKELPKTGKEIWKVYIVEMRE